VNAPAPIFYYDLASPACYLAAERVSFVLRVAPEWEPVRGGWDALPELGLDPDRSAFERAALERGLQAVRWPARWPPDSGAAMRAAAYAKAIGRAAAFSLAAFRQAFAAGRDLGDRDTVLIAAAACEMHPAAVIKAIESRAVANSLQTATDRAVAAGVRRLPAVRLGELVFEGDRGLDEAGAALLARR